MWVLFVVVLYNGVAVSSNMQFDNASMCMNAARRLTNEVGVGSVVIRTACIQVKADPAIQ